MLNLFKIRCFCCAIKNNPLEKLYRNEVVATSAKAKLYQIDMGEQIDIEAAKPNDKTIMHDFGEFGKWDMQTLLAQCNVVTKYSNERAEKDADFQVATYTGFISYYRLPAIIHEKKKALEKELKDLKSKFIGSITYDELRKLFKRVDDIELSLSAYDDIVSKATRMVTHGA